MSSVTRARDSLRMAKRKATLQDERIFQLLWSPLWSLVLDGTLGHAMPVGACEHFSTVWPPAIT